MLLILLYFNKNGFLSSEAEVELKIFAVVLKELEIFVFAVNYFQQFVADIVVEEM